MIEFKSTFDVPLDFEGECIIGTGVFCLIKNQTVHKLDGPAIVYKNGTKHWYANGIKHRLDGPASIYSDGEVHYVISGQGFSEQEFWNHPKVIKHKLDKILEFEQPNSITNNSKLTS